MTEWRAVIESLGAFFPAFAGVIILCLFGTSRRGKQVFVVRDFLREFMRVFAFDFASAYKKRCRYKSDCAYNGEYEFFHFIFLLPMLWVLFSYLGIKNASLQTK